MLLSSGGGFGTKKFNRETATLAPSTLLADEAQKDNDRDGLKDWEEGLWKTDPKNPDSDGDGTFDGEEVRNKRNPTKAGPDDEYQTIEETPLAEVVAQSESEKDLTLTDIFARDFVTGYFALKQGGRYNVENRDSFIQTLIAGITVAPVKEYTLNDLIISQKSDEETLKNYGNALGNILQSFYRNKAGDERLILDAAIRNEDKEELLKLERFAENYQAVARELLQIKVPLVLQSTHLEFMNGYESIGEALNGLQNVFDDPLGGSAYIKMHKESTELVNKAFGDLKNYFSKEGIGFKTGEGGYVFQI